MTALTRLRRLKSNNKNPGISSQEVLLTCLMINRVALYALPLIPSPLRLYMLQVVEYFQ